MLPFPFNNRLFQGFVVLIVFITVVLNHFVRLNHAESLRGDLMKLAASAALFIEDKDLPMDLSNNVENIQKYIALQNKLKKVLDLSENLVSVYLVQKDTTAGQYVFLADANRLGHSVLPGEKHAAVVTSELMNGFVSPSADQVPLTGNIGSTMSGYAPVKTDNGQKSAMIVLDYDTTAMRYALNRYSYMITLHMLLSLGIMTLFVTAVSKRFTRRLRRVTDEIDNILNGQKTQAIFDGEHDRLSELATRVTKLAERISTERMEMILAAVTSLVSALEVKDHYTYGHSTAVAAITEFLSNKMGIADDERFDVIFAAILHDIGKIGVMDAILNKHGKLTDEEWRQVKLHPVNGWKIISGIHSLDHVAEIIRYHHCRWDGGGYPESLKGSRIPVGARIIAVADSYQAMVSDRPYRKGMTHYEAVKELLRGAGTQFDPAVVRVFSQYEDSILKAVNALDFDVQDDRPEILQKNIDAAILSKRQHEAAPPNHLAGNNVAQETPPVN